MPDNETVHVQMSRRTAEKIREGAESWPFPEIGWAGLSVMLTPEDVAAVLYALTVLTPAPAPQQDAPPCP